MAICLYGITPYNSCEDKLGIFAIPALRDHRKRKSPKANLRASAKVCWNFPSSPIQITDSKEFFQEWCGGGTRKIVATRCHGVPCCSECSTSTPVCTPDRISLGLRTALGWLKPLSWLRARSAAE